MIKIVAKVDYCGKKKTCSFQSKEHRTITRKDLEKVEKFINSFLNCGQNVEISNRITYPDGSHGMVAGMSSRTLIINHTKKEYILNNLVEHINRNL